MISVEEASHLVREHFPRWKLGSHEVVADRNYPPFNRVMMDGIALKFDDYEAGKREFKISGVVAAGDVQATLKEGCVEIMTGAPLPEGADLVIQYEHLEIKDGVARVVVESTRKRFDSIHPEGSDCKKGEVVLRDGSAWNGPHVGIATSMGAKIETSSPKIMIISTGDELVEDNPLPHQIRRSNAYALKESLNLFGYMDITLDHLSDDPLVVSGHYEKHASLFDMLIYSGGVSKGKFDYLPSVWADMGVTRHFHGILQKPGKPLWFGTDEKRKTVIIGLPGNPVSGLVCLHRYFLPMREMSVNVSGDIKVSNTLTQFVPVQISFKEGEVWATPLKIKNSGEFTALAGSDGFIEVPSAEEGYKASQVMKFFSWRNF
jgi:molybdopterin molybdotransferase